MKPVLLLAALVAGCASSGVVPIGQDVLMITKGLAAPGVAGSSVLADIYIEANQHCAKESKVIETVNATSVDPIPFVRAGSAKLEFRCVQKKT